MSLLVYVAVGIAVFVGVGWLVGLLKKNADEPTTTKMKPAELTLADVGVGGVLRIPQFGSLLMETETYVTKKNRYENAEGKSSYELSCPIDGRTINLEWEREGKSIYASVGFEDENPSLGELGLSEKDLGDFDENQAGEFEWQGKTYTYVSSAEKSYYEDDDDEKESFYGWDFQTPEGQEYISIEKWAGDAQFYVYKSQEIEVDEIEIFDKG